MATDCSFVNILTLDMHWGVLHSCLTINVLMNSSFGFDALHFGCTIVNSEGSHVMNFKSNCNSFSELCLSKQCKPWQNAVCSSGSHYLNKNAFMSH